MRADQKVGPGVALATTGSPVTQKGLAREKERGAGNVGHRQSHRVVVVQRLDGRERQ